MKNVSSINLSMITANNAINRDTKKQIDIPDGAVIAINQLFRELKIIFPAWVKSFKSNEDYITAKKLWLETLVNEGITSFEPIRFALDKAKKEETAPYPTIAKFINWCKQGQLKNLGLPTPEELRYRLNKFSHYGGFANVDNFEFVSSAEFILITNLAIKLSELTEPQLQVAIKDELKKMEKRLLRGEILPEIQKSIPSKVEYLDPDKVKQGWANLKALVARG
ncbi:replication protein P [Gallibacterium genomosp. 3]|uniref:replication protein P n=1 Tax=Gallibacterium genomosp. 3 TaxID=505345 RepID=UPI0008025B44|nr:replication protein P [Gallibacterium genomosp. 3]